MEVNQKVANFTLQTDEDKTVSLSDYAGKPVVLFFYPRADTPGCTIEACGFRDTFKKIQAAGAVVLGISRDTPKAQAKFKAKYDLPYTLLADVDEKVCNQFGVLKEKNMYGKKVWGIERTTFLIGPDQKLIHIFPKVTPEGHAEEVLALVKEWQEIAQIRPERAKKQAPGAAGSAQILRRFDRKVSPRGYWASCWWRRSADGGVLAGRIVEVEAYLGPHNDPPDPAAHTHRGPTPRNLVLFGPAGHAYMYLIYGKYFCANISCEREGLGGRHFAPSPGASGGTGADGAQSWPGRRCAGAIDRFGT